MVPDPIIRTFLMSSAFNINPPLDYFKFMPYTKCNMGAKADERF
jgi:hypothetical protein